MKPICKPEHRNFLAFVLAIDPQARKALSQMKRLKAYNLRPDYMLVRNPVTNVHDRLPDPGVWNADMDAFGGTNNMGVCMIRRPDGSWSFHQQ